MTLPTLSVIVPNFNHAQFLPRSLGAIVSQSAPPLEVLVMDDASTDNSVEVIEALAKEHHNIRLVRNEKNLGVMANVNRGISLAQGQYVLSSGADDEVAPGFFEKSLSLLAQHPEAALSCSVGDYREAQTGVRWYWGVGMAGSPVFLSPEQLAQLERMGKLFIAPNSVIYKKSALNQAGNFVPDLKFCADWFANYVAAFRHGICFVPEPLAIFHVQPNSYYHRIRGNSVEYRTVLTELLGKLNKLSEESAIELLRASGALFIFGAPILRVMLSRPEYRHFITPTFLRKNLAHSAKLLLKNNCPAWMLKLYLKNSSYRPATGADQGPLPT